MTAIVERMSRELLVTEPAATVGEATERMAARNVGSILVMEGERLVGILTERDVLGAFARGIPRETPVRQCMTPNPETCEPTESLEHATVLMLHGGFRHLPVLEGQKLVGMLSLRDVVATQIADLAPRGV
jgi:CBS domain-containing protein